MGIHRNIIGVCGTLGAGKTSVARIISSSRNYDFVSVDELVKTEPDAVLRAKKVANTINSMGANVVVDGIRHVKEFDMLKDWFGGFKLVFVDAEQTIRMRHLVTEDRPGVPNDTDSFEVKDAEDKQRFDVENLFSMADAEILNSTDMLHLEREVDQMMTNFGEDVKDRVHDMTVRTVRDEEP